MQGNMRGKEAFRLEPTRGPGEAAAVAGAPSRPPSPAAGRRVRRARFFLETDALHAALETARDTLSQADGPALLVEGEAGAGKSAFLERLAQSAVRTDVCRVEVRHPLGEAGLHARLAQAFGLAPTGDGAALAARIADRAGGDAPLVLVDDAQRLSPFGLRALLDLRRSVRRLGGRLALAVSAPPGALERTLALPSFSTHQGAFARLALPRFGEEETLEYLRRAAEHAGAGDGPGFDEAQIRALHRAASGLPGQIDRAAAELRRGLHPRPYRRVKRRYPVAVRKGWALPAAVLGVMLGSGAYLAHAVLFSPPGDPAGLASGAVPAGEPAAPSTLPLALEVPEGPPPAPVVSGPMPQVTAVAPVAAAEPPAPSPASAAEELSRAQPAAPPGALNAAAAPAAPVLGDRAWLMAQDPKRYTIQLASTPDESKAVEFIAKHPLRGRTVAVETQRGARTWYVVLHGTYANPAEAQRAIEGLPAALRKNDPFARRVESVQAMAVAGG